MTRVNKLNYPREDIRKINYNSLNRFMQSHGFEYIAGTDFSDVYEHPKLNYVIKVFQHTDSAYRKFLSVAMKHQDNVYFPKFRGKMMRINRTFYAIRMEKLDLGRSDAPILEIIKAYTVDTSRKDTTDGIIDRYSDYTEFQNDMVQTKQKYPQLIEAIEILRNNKRPNDHWDLGFANIMFRGSVPVIIDPWSV